VATGKSAATAPDPVVTPARGEPPEPIVRAYAGTLAGVLAALHEALGILVAEAVRLRTDIARVEAGDSLSQEQLLRRSAKILSEAARASRLVRRAARQI
jgi:hypothetical protein